MFLIIIVSPDYYFFIQIYKKIVPIEIVSTIQMSKKYKEPNSESDSEN